MLLLGRYDTTTRQEHVTHARASAAQAISAILAPDETKDYDYLPFFYSRIFGLSWQVSRAELLRQLLSALGRLAALPSCTWGMLHLLMRLAESSAVQITVAEASRSGSARSSTEAARRATRSCSSVPRRTSTSAHTGCATARWWVPSQRAAPTRRMPA